MKQLNDEAFDEYIREQLEKLKKKDQHANEEVIRINSFLYQILTDLQRDKNKKQKLTFLSPIHFTDYPLIKELSIEQENKDNDALNDNGNEINDNINEIDDNNVLITTTFKKKIYKNLPNIKDD